MTCRYARPAEVGFVNVNGVVFKMKIENGPLVCSWADIEATPALANMPRWIQSVALTGHMVNDGEICKGCPCFQPAEPAVQKE